MFENIHYNESYFIREFLICPLVDRYENYNDNTYTTDCFYVYFTFFFTTAAPLMMMVMDLQLAN